MSETMIKVTNRDSGNVGYLIPDSGVHRSFAPGETKTVPLEELKQLQWVPGGDYMLKNLLIVNNKDALSALNMEVEPEYFYTEVEIKKLLNEGSLDQLKDALDYAPDGAIELIKKIAVDTQLPDMRKRKIISEATGFNIDNAINVNNVLNSEDDSETAEDTSSKSARRAAPIITEQEPLVTKPASKYKVVTTYK
jgi:hypothetical protein